MSRCRLNARAAVARGCALNLVACSTLCVLLAAVPAGAADLLSGTWTSGEGADRLIYVFKVTGDRFTGIVCGRCDDPDDVFELEEGRLLSETRASFVIRHDAIERGGRPVAAHLDRVEATLARNAATLSVRSASSETAAAVSRSLVRVVPDFALVAGLLPSPAAAASTPSASFRPGHWVSAGRVAQQNWILKVRDNRIWGLVCGPCTPAVVTMIDGRIAGDTITFNINHIDTPPDATRQGIQRNVMTGTIAAGDNGNIMRFKWVSEGRPDRTGEIVMFGPLR
jgi:hypothetical protein